MLSASDINQMKFAQSSADRVLPVLLERWSPRAFADRDVAAADLKTIFEAARWAPSSYNEQPWRFFVGHRGSETYSKILAALVPFNQDWAKGAPVLVLGLARTRFSHNDTPNNYAAHDLGAAMALMAVQATVLGLAAHQMAGFDWAKAREAFAIPDTFAMGSVMAIGYRGELTDMEEKFQAQEQAPRSRKPLSEIVLSDWDQPADLG
jgi:nitroreductase